jgi:predicted RecB family nuclease
MVIGMATRTILLDGRAAHFCERAAHNRFALPPAPQADPSPSLAKRFSDGLAFEEVVTNRIINSHPYGQVVRIEDMSASDSVAQTLEHMHRRTPIILHGYLPDDRSGGRTGRPDVLIAGTTGYHPVDIKHHNVLSGKGGMPVRVSTLENPYRAGASDSEMTFRHTASGHQDDLFQISHYWRMLEACGYADERPYGGIIGADTVATVDTVSGDEAIAWVDLSEPAYGPGRRKDLSVLDLYDAAFTERIRIATVALGGGKAAEIAGRPDCAECVWKTVCLDTLPADDLSRTMTTAVGPLGHLALRQAGVRIIKDLSLVSVDSLMGTGYGDVAGTEHNYKDRISKAIAAAQIRSSGYHFIAATGASVEDLGPVSDVEYDLDVEWSVSGYVYLWGVLRTENHQSEYTSFFSLDVTDPRTEAALAQECMDWLAAEIASVESSGHTATVFHYSPAEKIRCRLIKDRVPEFSIPGGRADPELWFDMMPPIRKSVMSGYGHSVKTLAIHGAGRDWRDEEPSGAASQDWFEEAAGGDTAAAERLLQYNEDDTYATLRVREWLRRGPEHWTVESAKFASPASRSPFF